MNTIKTIDDAIATLMDLRTKLTARGDYWVDADIQFVIDFLNSIK